MLITVFGATGGTGQQVIRQACEAGHEVTAVVRDPARFGIEHPGLTVVQADVMTPEAIRSAVKGRDAVVSAIGSRDIRVPTTVCSDSATSVIEAMNAEDVRRLVVVSASGLVTDGDGPLTRYIAKPIVQTILKHPFADMRQMEAVVRRSDLDWTIVRPPRLTDRPRTGSYRSAVNRNVRGGLTVSRADVADCILRCLADQKSVRTVISIAN